jgi:hypothetical protein
MNKKVTKFVDFVTRHKCIVTQGAAFVNMGIIFFVGGVHIRKILTPTTTMIR